MDELHRYESDLQEFVALTDLVRVHLRRSFDDMLAAWLECSRNQGRLLFFGNGGSAGQAQHMAAELVVRLQRDRAPIPAISLTADVQVLTACANDHGYERVFARQIEALGRPGDLAVGLSTSGRSPNVIAGLRAARERGLRCAALTGQDGEHLAAMADAVIVIPSRSTARIQEMHLVLGHMLCARLEEALGLA